VHRQSKSKLSVREYCAAAGISEPSFYAWRRSLARRDVMVGPSPAQEHVPGNASTPPPPIGTRRRPRREARTAHESIPLRPQFLPVTISPPLSHSIEAVLASGLVLRVPAHDAAALRMVLEVVEGQPC